MKRGRAAKRGLTLIEVLLAVVILGISSSAILVGVSRCLAVIRKARHYENARRFLYRVELEHPLDREDIEASDRSGSFEGVAGYSWMREIEPVDPEFRPGLYRVSTRVLWSDRGEERAEEVTTYVYRPKDD